MEPTIVLPLLLEILNDLGIIAFTVSGVVKGLQKKFDILGCLLLGAVTALGGGVIRDLIAGIVPPTVFRIELYADISLLVGAIAFVAMPVGLVSRRGFLYADALGLAVFSALGADVGLSRGLGPVGTAFAAMITGTGGGMVRDVLAGDVPIVLHKEVYATLALTGGFLFYALMLLDVPRPLSALAITVIIFALRIVALERGWALPRRNV